MLLQRSSPLRDSDDFYRRILPPELSELRFSQETSDEVVAELCAKISRDPDEAFISSLCGVGVDLATRTVSKVLIDPPRPLTIREYSQALSLVNEYLPYCLEEDPEFLPKDDLERLFQTVTRVYNLKEGSTLEEESARNLIIYFAPKLLESLTLLGIGKS
jgi:hypothetical protein